LIDRQTDTSYDIIDKNQILTLKEVQSMVDLGLHFDSNLTFRDDTSQKINKADSVLGIMKINFIYMDEITFILLYKSMLQFHTEFANTLWCPFKQGDITEI